ncbi:MAG: isomerase [Acidobacteria bacterium]|nr:isomerase [Acidobacteriota bacterium]
MSYFRHPSSIVESDNIGTNTRVWAFAHILPNAIVGEDCNVCDHVFIENDVRIGNRVTIKSGVQLWDGVTLEDDVFIGANATFTNDNFPRSRQYPEKFLRTVVREGASIGANATILSALIIGKKAMVGAGAVVTHDVPPYAIVTGNPARIVGYVDSKQARHVAKLRLGREPSADLAPNDLKVHGVNLYKMPIITDLRGNLTVGELGKELPFVPQRYFVLFEVPSREVRGEHAHRALHQFFVCLKGDCSLVVDDGENRAELILNNPSIGVHVAPMVWGIQYKFSLDAMLLVLASDKYDPDDYIRDYEEFVRLFAKQNKR